MLMRLKGKNFPFWKLFLFWLYIGLWHKIKNFPSPWEYSQYILLVSKNVQDYCHSQYVGLVSHNIACIYLFLLQTISDLITQLIFVIAKSCRFELHSSWNYRGISDEVSVVILKVERSEQSFISCQLQIKQCSWGSRVKIVRS